MVARKGMPSGVYWTQVRNLFFQLSIVGLYQTSHSVQKSDKFPKSGLSGNLTFSFPDAGLLKIEKDPIFFSDFFFNLFC